MSYKRKFTNQHGSLSPISGINSNSDSWNSGMNKNPTGGWTNEFAFRNYQSRLPEVYTGHPNRIERYNQYEMMDVDPEINACLDILAEFSTQENDQNRTPFEIVFHEDPTSTEVDVIKKQLQQWVKLNELDSRIFKIFRNAVKYGDQVFIRDPENFKLYWVDMTKVVKVIVNESEGKKPEQYVIKDINPNLQNLSVAEKTTTDFQAQPPTAGYSAPYSYTVPNEPYGTTGSRFSLGINESAIDARHIVHLSLTEGLDRYWPFGQSILENIFKVYKQKELLEDAVLIYRVSRAPERRVFKIDVGNMPSHMAMQFVNRIKDEIHQRRIPSVHGGQSTVDATYNPLCLDLSTRIPLLDGRTLMLSELITEFEQGKENWAYSCDPATGRVVPGLINWAGITRRNTETIKLTFDNGNTLICTPDHKLVSRYKGFIEAKDALNESIMPFNSRNAVLKDASYTEVYDSQLGKWVLVHRMVADFFKKINKHQEFTFLPENVGKFKSVVHHKDFNRFNNDPKNLQWMNWEDYFQYHNINNSWNNVHGENLLEARRRYEVMLTERNLISWQDHDNEDKIHETHSWTEELLTMILAEYKKTKSSVKTVNNLNNSEKFIDLYNNGIDGTFKKHKRTKIYRKNLYKVLNYFGISGFDSCFKERVDNFNHRVVSIERVEYRDTGTLTIDGLERWHGYHTFAIEAGVFIKNSINEDYFFPVTAEGRGSSVEMLQGGCFAMNTKVSLLDGRELSIADISSEMADGKKLWTYSCEPVTGKVVPGLITWAGVTQESAKVLKITLDNGKEIVCTPEHKFPSYEVEFKRADEFLVGDSMIPLYRKFNSVTKNSNEYEQYFDNADKTWKFTHQLIADTFDDLDHGLIKQFEYSSWEDFRQKESLHNHTIVAIEYLDDPIQVGTLTIDGDEIYHDYHTFALSAGVFTKNSSLGEIDDLKYFNNRLARGLRIPSSYLPTGPEESERPLVDGKVGTALIQEFRFNQYCERLQNYLTRKLNEEFKLFMKWRGFNIDVGLFDIKFNPPQNFAAYRQSEIDQVRVNVYNSVATLPYMSIRFAMERFLGLTQEEIKKNEKMWHEERDKPSTEESKGTDLRNIGLSTSDIESDLEIADNLSSPENELGEVPPETIAPVTAPTAPGPAPTQPPT